MDLHCLGWLFLPILAHVLYAIPPANGEGTVTLHNGDDFSSSDEPPRPDRLISVRALSSSNVVHLQATGSKDTSVEVDTSAVIERPCWLIAETPRTFIELAPEKFHGYLQHEGLTHVIEARAQMTTSPGRELYSKYTKTALSDSDGTLRFLTSPVGLPIEIVPLSAGPVRPGDPLTFQIVVAAKPASDLQLRISHRASDDAAPSEDFVMRTDSNGCCSVTISEPGLWRLHTITMTAHPDAREADWESIWASLTFRL